MSQRAKPIVSIPVFLFSCAAESFAQPALHADPNSCMISCPDGSAFPNEGAAVTCDAQHSPICQCEDGKRRMAGCQPRGDARPSHNEMVFQTSTETGRLVLRGDSKSSETVLFTGFYLGEKTGLVQLVDQPTPFKAFLEGSFVTAVLQSRSTDKNLLVQLDRETTDAERTLLQGDGALLVISTNNKGNHSIFVGDLPN
jgi:hypothetical protein